VPRILGDEGRLQQIIWNLLSNAVKFTPRGGTITIRVADAGLLLRISVEDTGKGIEPDYLPHVFEAFSQEDASMSRSHEGIGLGLSIVRSLVELHGGRIRAASDGSGRGATFTVELPVIDPSPQSGIVTARKQDAPPASGLGMGDAALQGLQVLVIDDQDFTRELVAAIFRRSGADVRTASSVRQGIGELEGAAPGVVVCDLAMPEEDGYAFLRAIRARPAPSNATPVIALTAFGRPEDRQHALAAGFDAYLKKPIDPEELTSTALRLAARG
jgi:CheY-like chemotaxis protein